MSSASPGHVMFARDPGDGPQDTSIGGRAPAHAAGTPLHTATQKRPRDSPASPAHTRALGLLSSLTDTVRTSAARGLRALSDSIERPHGGAVPSDSSDSGPPSPTDNVRAAQSTPAGKRRRTTLTEARTRKAHAHWRGSHWDFSGAIRDGMFYRMGEDAPTTLSFPRQSDARAPGAVEAPAPIADGADEAPERPASAMSAASAPAVLSTPRSHHTGPTPRSRLQPPRMADDGWIDAVPTVDVDPFVGPDPGDTFMDDVGDSATADTSFVRALCVATSLLSSDTTASPEACGAILAFQTRLRALDPQGNFVAHCPAGESAAAELRAIRLELVELARAQRAQRECARTQSSARDAPDSHVQAAPRAFAAASCVGGQTTSVDSGMATADPAAAQTGRLRDELAAPPLGTLRARQDPRACPGVTPADPTDALAHHVAKAVGRHDARRTVFYPAAPFGGRIKGAATMDSVRRLDLATSCSIRDAVNAALRDRATAQMDESVVAVQVSGVNWTERGNLCLIVSEGFTAADLLLHADAAAAAAQLGAGWKASRDVPVHKVVLRGVPTRRPDGSLVTEDDVLSDLRAHSSAFKGLTLADSVKPAGWISHADARVHMDYSSIVLDMASAGDAARFLAMKRCLFAMGRLCEPGEFQPRDRERICRTCWNPLARHRDRDFKCRERCRLCGGKHAEEDHTCSTCDVLARPCEHIPLRCVNCNAQHAADDGTCEYRRRLRGTHKSAPPMSSSSRARAGVAKSSAPGTGAGKAKTRGKKVRVLDPDEPFPADATAAVATSPPASRPMSPLPTQCETPAPARAPALAHADKAAVGARGRAPAAVTVQMPAAAADAATAPTQAASALSYAEAAAAPAGSAARAVAPAPQPPTAPQQSRRQRAIARRKAEDATGSSAATQPAPPPGAESACGAWAGTDSPALDALEIEAMDDLVGPLLASRVAQVPAPSVPPGGVADRGDDTPVPRRPPSLRGAALEADREARRRRAAVVLHRAFNTLPFADVLAALRKCSDDYATAIAWASDTQAAKRKPGMQSKSAKSLQKLFAEMTDAAARHRPNANTDTPAVPTDA